MPIAGSPRTMLRAVGHERSLVVEHVFKRMPRQASAVLISPEANRSKPHGTYAKSFVLPSLLTVMPEFYLAQSPGAGGCRPSQCFEHLVLGEPAVFHALLPGSSSLARRAVSSSFLDTLKAPGWPTAFGRCLSAEFILFSSWTLQEGVLAHQRANVRLCQTRQEQGN